MPTMPQHLPDRSPSECRSSAACYGIVLDASLITGIDPPPEVQSALAAINTAYNQVSSLGTGHVLDMRLDQEYLRSQAVNSEKGAPMGIVISYEMFVSDPIAYLFKNADLRGARWRRT
jgi:hypothetical protein